MPAFPLGLFIAAAMHVGLGIWAIRSAPSLGVWAAHMQQAVRTELSREQTVDLLPPPPPPPVPDEKPAPPPPVAEKAAPRPAPAAPKAAEPSHTPPPAPAQAAAVMAQEEDPDAPVDLSDNTFVTGKASVYAGGVTASKGTNTVEVKTNQVASNGTIGNPVQPPPKPVPKAVPVDTGPDRSAPAALLEDDWSCPWPAEAESEQIDEQTAVVRVSVSKSGQVSQVSLVKDPGYGFGRAAVSCALKARFAPARDRAGNAIDSTSPPIRVHFFR